ncbi:hypothetical protein M758_UG188500 [Ceratodon purpureus]|nr:hypothetical protein M758_UG187200 [Ceratodon purpureus]KAG0595687.1 hypothetical protein M758_UG188500 [Ceratodon purpureus]
MSRFLVSGLWLVFAHLLTFLCKHLIKERNEAYGNLFLVLPSGCSDMAFSFTSWLV